MSVEVLLRQARDLGITLAVDAGRLRYYPAGRMPTFLAEALRAQRGEVISYLAGIAGTQEHKNTRTCGACGQRLSTHETRVAGTCLRCMGDEEFHAAIRSMGTRRRVARAG